MGRCASNFSRVSTVCVTWWLHRSLSAPILAMYSGIGACGTWQSTQVARTPVRFLSWVEPMYSMLELFAISWQLVAQNASVLV